MKRKILTISITVIFLLSSITVLSSDNVKAGSKNIKINDTSIYILSYRVHNINTGEDFQTIQEAIDDEDTTDGHTIKADEGLYYENVVVNKEINLVGENKDTTKIDGNSNGNVITVTANNVKIEGFTLKKSGVMTINGGINLENCNDAYIYNNIFLRVANGVFLYNSQNSKITSNQFIREYMGFEAIRSESSSNILIKNNNINFNGGGSGITLEQSDYVTIEGNTISNCDVGGVFIQRSTNVDFFKNTVENNNGYGMSVFNSYNNINIYKNTFKSNTGEGISALFSDGVKVYLNNFIGNRKPQGKDHGNNIWYNEELKKGNYWDDYTTRYPNASKKIVEGIWDTPYDIEDGDNQDLYPLINPYSKSKSESKNSNFLLYRFFLKAFHFFPKLFHILKLYFKI